MDYEAIANEAFAAAAKATNEALAARGGDGFPCGFAWVIVKPANSKMGKILQQKFDCRKAYRGGVQVWNPSKNYAQNVDSLYAGAQAFEEVLKKHGIDCYADSRWD